MSSYYNSFLLRFWSEPSEGFVAEAEHIQSGVRKRVSDSNEFLCFVLEQDKDIFTRLKEKERK